MTARLQSIADFLRDHGPATTKQISAHFGWLPQTGSAAVSHAQAYGLIFPASARALNPEAFPDGVGSAGDAMTIYRFRDAIQLPDTGDNDERSLVVAAYVVGALMLALLVTVYAVLVHL